MKKVYKILILFGILLVVFVIGTVFLKSLDNERSKNHDIRREEAVKNISSALQDYANKHNGMYPADLSELQKFFPDRYLPTYFGEIYYRYKRIDNNHYCLYSNLETRKDVFKVGIKTIMIVVNSYCLYSNLETRKDVFFASEKESG